MPFSTVLIPSLLRVVSNAKQSAGACQRLRAGSGPRMPQNWGLDCELRSGRLGGHSPPAPKSTPRPISREPSTNSRGSIVNRPERVAFGEMAENFGNPRFSRRLAGSLCRAQAQGSDHDEPEAAHPRSQSVRPLVPPEGREGARDLAGGCELNELTSTLSKGATALVPPNWAGRIDVSGPPSTATRFTSGAICLSNSSRARCSSTAAGSRYRMVTWAGS